MNDSNNNVGQVRRNWCWRRLFTANLYRSYSFLCHLLVVSVGRAISHAVKRMGIDIVSNGTLPFFGILWLSLVLDRDPCWRWVYSHYTYKQTSICCQMLGPIQEVWGTGVPSGVQRQPLMTRQDKWQKSAKFCEDYTQHNILRAKRY